MREIASTRMTRAHKTDTTSIGYVNHFCHIMSGQLIGRYLSKYRFRNHQTGYATNNPIAPSAFSSSLGSGGNCDSIKSTLRMALGVGCYISNQLATRSGRRLWTAFIRDPIKATKTNHKAIAVMSAIVGLKEVSTVSRM